MNGLQNRGWTREVCGELCKEETYVNEEIGETFLNERFSERLIFTRFCANGNRPASIGGGSERDETAVK